MPRVVCVTGPTSSGKTALGLALAKELRGEVINADARQLYRDAPIGTGVPSGEWQELDGQRVYHVEGVPHHLMAILPPDEAWSVSRWKHEAEARIERVLARGKMPIVVGGTGLYVRALTEGFVFEGEPNPEQRARLLALPVEERVRQLTERLPDAAAHIDLKNPHRVLRALERLEAGQHLAPITIPSPYAWTKLALAHAPDVLRTRVAATLHEQLARGWIDEVRALVEGGVPASAPLMTSIGFRVIAERLRQETLDVAETEAAVLRDTWQYVRRQMTWFRKEPHLVWVADAEEALARIHAGLSTSA